MIDYSYHMVNKRVKVFHSDLLDQFRIKHNYTGHFAQVKATQLEHQIIIISTSKSIIYTLAQAYTAHATKLTHIWTHMSRT